MRWIGEFIVLLLGSSVVGWLIGTLQRFVAFGVWGGFGFNRDAFYIACFEGGSLGSLFAIPTGFVVWYAVLHRRATAFEVSAIVLTSLLGGCCLGAALFWPSAFLTPVLTVAAAALVKRRRHRWAKEEAAG